MMSCEDYHEKFKSLSEAYVSCGGSIGNEEGLVEGELIRLGLTLATAEVTVRKESEDTVSHAYL